MLMEAFRSVSISCQFLQIIFRFEKVERRLEMISFSHPLQDVLSTEPSRVRTNVSRIFKQVILNKDPVAPGSRDLRNV